MLKETLNQIMPILVQAIVTILGVIISAIGVVAVKFIQTQKDAVVAKLGVDKYTQDKQYALDAWNFVEEKYRISGLVTVTMNEKIASFETELLKKAPYLNQTELDSLRLSLAGVVNQGKNAVVAPIEASQMAVQPLQ